MTFDFKKEYKEYYRPKNKPEIINIPQFNFIAIRGKGNPNEEGGEYKAAIGVLYAVAYTLKMSYKTDYKIEGFFEYVVPPLEGFWWQDNVESIDYTDKSAFNWISVIRLPDFITKKDFDWAVETASKKKKMDCSGAEFLSIDEGLCVQIMHIGAFDDEPATVAMMDKYLEEMLEHLGWHFAHLLSVELGIPNQPWTATEIQCYLTETIVHWQTVAVSFDATLVAQRMQQAFAQGNTRILNGMMLIHIEVALGVDGEVHHAVLANLFQHVVEETETGRDVAFA
jgi:hypothetical protein